MLMEWSCREQGVIYICKRVHLSHDALSHYSTWENVSGPRQAQKSNEGQTTRTAHHSCQVPLYWDHPF